MTSVELVIQDINTLGVTWQEEVSRNGKFNGKQRYICKSCRKTFNDFTHSQRYNKALFV